MVDGRAKTGESRCLEVPEEFRPREYGGRMIEPVRLGDVCMLAQSRDKHNSALRSLEASIESNELLQPPIVARMTQLGFKEYIEFVNRIWGTSEQFDNFAPSADGSYTLVIAGHTRFRAILNIENRRAAAAAQAGYNTSPADAMVHCRIYDAPDPETIISVQLDENLHEKVPEERTALAIVEAYYFGLELGKWTDQHEYHQAVDGKFTQTQLRRALAFSRLDEEFRKIVFAKGIPYVLGTEVAEAVDDFVEFTLQKYHGGATYSDLPPDVQKQLDEYRTNWIGKEISYLLARGKRVNISAYRTKLEGYRQDWVVDKDTEGGAFDEIQMFEMADPMADWQAARLAIYNQYRGAVADLNRLTSETAAVSIAAHLDVIGRTGSVSDAEDLLAEVQGRSNEFAKTVGQHATIAANNKRNEAVDRTESMALGDF